jgi:hypothetical protein
MTLKTWKKKIENMYYYIQGNLRYYFFLKSLLPNYLIDQIVGRVLRAKRKCVENGICLECGCDIPQLFFADKSCGGNCYPKMLSKKEYYKNKKQ